MRADRAGPPLVWAGSVAPVTVRVCKEPRTGADRTTDRSRSSIATCRSVDLAPAFVCTTKETIPRYKPPRSVGALARGTRRPATAGRERAVATREPLFLR